MAEDEATPSVADEPAQATASDGKPTMAVKVYAPFQIYFEGDAYSVSAVNATGPFDILPRHHNFLCMLVPCALKIDAPSGVKTVKVSRALMHVEANRVVVFMDV
jgi:F0F1-type ATP synthase epsilon subunit